MTVEEYVNRELERPKTTYAAPIGMALLMIVFPFVMFLITKFSGVLHSSAFLVPFCLISELILLRILLIKAIMCYQHYASEKLRRYCKCMPSCSEYAIAVLKKYLLPVAIYKIIRRLRVTCDGEMKIDLP